MYDCEGKILSSSGKDIVCSQRYMVADVLWTTAATSAAVTLSGARGKVGFLPMQG